MRRISLLKPLFFLILISIVFTSCKSTAVATSKSHTKNNSIIEKIIYSASQNLGAPYKYAGTTKSGFDCSGLVFTTFNQYDIKLPRSSSEQSKVGIDLGKNI